MDNNEILKITYPDGSTELRSVKRVRLLMSHETKEFQIAFFTTLENNGRVDIITAVYEVMKPQYNFSGPLKLKKL